MNDASRRHGHLYQACYCEENVYLLGAELAGSVEGRSRNFAILFISNPLKAVAFTKQRSQPEGVIFWDYHVVVMENCRLTTIYEQFGRLHQNDRSNNCWGNLPCFEFGRDVGPCEPGTLMMKKGIRGEKATNDKLQVGMDHAPGPSFAFPLVPDIVPSPITVSLRYGPVTQVYTVDRNLGMTAILMLREAARSLIGGLPATAEVHLFKFNPHSLHVLTHVNTTDDLRPGGEIEVIVMDRHEKPSAPHELDVTSYKTPTFCDYCGEFLLGLVKQGLQCRLCRGNYHKKCAFTARNNCTCKLSSLQPQRQQQGQQQIQSPKYNLPHTLIIHNFKTLTVCKICDKMLLGIIKQGFRCRDCKVAVHKKCAHLLAQNCELSEHAIEPSLERMSFMEAGSSTNSVVDSVNRGEDLTDSTTEQGDGIMIPLARLPGQAALMRNQPTLEGWMIHFMINETERRLKHYWVLGHDALHLYCDTGIAINKSRPFLTLPLAQIAAVTAYTGDSLNDRYPPHLFEIRTINNETYCCGENLESFAAAPSGPFGRSASRRPLSNAPWLEALRIALMPPASRQDPVQPDNASTAIQFSNLYQVLSDKTLGAGQFGTVYTGVHRTTGREVAVKVISKERFTTRSASAESLRSEVGILQGIYHPGIVRLESMFETSDKIFVVMEKLNGDMLEMILSQANGRLSERVTKFLIIQILAALRYLHNKGIAHCDLKPENVLLSHQHSSFPQTKLCDFGYARFIGETQFRKTIVGTPAYLPPEVLQKRGYNKSLDMWSVGVIIYVTLSGTFPFNDGEEVSDQIENAAFMFPSESWKAISGEAINLIQQLLRVNIEERLSIDGCLEHCWLQSGELFEDVRQLEVRVGNPYITDPSSVSEISSPPLSLAADNDHLHF